MPFKGHVTNAFFAGTLTKAANNRGRILLCENKTSTPACNR
jgi:hypothetical protein